MIFGALDQSNLKLAAMKDMNRREMLCLIPLFILTIYYGVQPGPILDACAASVELLVKNFDAAVAVTKTAAAAVAH